VPAAVVPKATATVHMVNTEDKVSAAVEATTVISNNNEVGVVTTTKEEETKPRDA
jgi:hypothetical protein